MCMVLPWDDASLLKCVPATAQAQLAVEHAAAAQLDLVGERDAVGLSDAIDRRVDQARDGAEELVRVHVAQTKNAFASVDPAAAETSL